jgi:hypothetical protein
MKRVIEAVEASIPIDFREVDIDGDIELRRLYDREVPVLEVDGRKAFKYRVTARELRRYIEKSDERRMKAVEGG